MPGNFGFVGVSDSLDVSAGEVQGNVVVPGRFEGWVVLLEPSGRWGVWAFARIRCVRGWSSWNLVVVVWYGSLDDGGCGRCSGGVQSLLLDKSLGSLKFAFHMKIVAGL